MQWNEIMQDTYDITRLFSHLFGCAFCIVLYSPFKWRFSDMILTA